MSILDRVPEKQTGNDSHSGLYSQLDMSQFQNHNTGSESARNALPAFDLANLAERCQELGSDAGACVKAIKRRGLS